MTSQGSGLQRKRFLESFQDNSENNVYTTKTFLERTISNYLNTNSVVDLNIGNGVSIVSTVTGTTKTIVNVGLNASLNNLNNVNTNPSGANVYLKYNGSCWVAGTGISGTSFSITDLDDVTGNLQSHSYLHSHDGISAQFIPDDNIKINNLTTPVNSGLNITSNSSYPVTASVTTQFSNFIGLSTDTGLSSGHYVFVTPSNTTRKIQKSEIDVTEFKNFTSGVCQVVASGLSSTNIQSGSYAEGLTNVGGTFNLNLSTYLTGAGGILPISQGGTSGANAGDARTNLGLSYNFSATCYPYDIMAYSQPIFRDNMLGDSIRLVPGVSLPVNVLTGGTSYFGSNYYILSEDGNRIDVSVTTGSSGEIVSISLTDPYNGFPYIYEDFITTVIGGGHTGTSAFIGVCVNPSYINFGMSYGEDGTGFRSSDGNIEVRNNSVNSWELVNVRFGVSELGDVNLPAVNDGDFLIYNGTCFMGYNISGDISIGPSGIATITTGGLSVGQIDFGTPAPGVSDFQNLTGTTGNIQQQLDDKLYTYAPIDTNRNILVLNGTSTIGTCSSTLNFTIDGTDADTCPQVPIIEPSNTHGVEFQNIYHSYSGPISGVSTSITNYEVVLLDSSTNIANKVTMQNFLNISAHDQGGINNNGSNDQLQLNIQGLSTYTLPLEYDDFVAVGTSDSASNILNNKISIKDLLSVPFYTEPSSASYYYTGALAFFTNVSGTSYLGIATGNGSSWYAIEPDNVI